MKEIDYEAARSGKRKVVTRRGHPVRLVSNEGNEPFVLVGYVTDSRAGVGTSPQSWSADGHYWERGQSGFDLIQDPEVIEFKQWVNVYEWGVVSHDSRHEALLTSEGCVYVRRAVPFTIRIVGDKVEIFGGTEERKDDE